MNVKALTRSATVTIALIAAATIGSELSPSFKDLLATIGGHHWIGKSVLSIVFFGVLHLVFSRFTAEDLNFKDGIWLASSVILSGLAILVFYILHF